MTVLGDTPQVEDPWSLKIAEQDATGASLKGVDFGAGKTHVRESHGDNKRGDALLLPISLKMERKLRIFRKCDQNEVVSNRSRIGSGDSLWTCNKCHNHRG